MSLLYMWAFFWLQKQKIGFVWETIHVQISLAQEQAIQCLAAGRFNGRILEQDSHP